MNVLLILLLVCIVDADSLKRKISVLIDDSIDINVYNQIKSSARNVFQRDSKVQLHAEFINWNSSLYSQVNQLQITSDLTCKHLLNNSIAVLIVQTNYENQQIAQNVFSAVSYSLAFYRVPVLSVTVRGAEFSKKEFYPTFLRLSPPFIDEANVFVELLNQMNYRQVIILTIENDLDAQQFTAKFGELTKNKNIHVQKNVRLKLNALSFELIEEKLKEATSNTILMYASQEHAQKVFGHLNEFDQNGRVWLINELASKASNLPNGFLSVRMRQDMLNSVHDGFVIMHKSAQILSEFNETDLPPLQCKKMLKSSNEWTNSIGMKLFNKMANLTMKRDALYEIMNVQEFGLEVVGFMDQHSTLILNEWEIVWPGGQSLKPLEVTLPKHLRCLSVFDDPPFVYSFAVVNGSKCENYTNIRINGMIVNGPWHLCLKRTSNETSSYCCAGYAVDLLVKLSQMKVHGRQQAFTFDLFLNESYGAVLLEEKGGYHLTGVLGELDSKQADLAIGALSVNPERKRYIDLSVPWLYHGIKILEKWKPRESPLSSFTQPFKKSLWFALFGLVLLVGLIIYFLDWKSPFEQFDKADSDSLSLANNQNLNNETRLTFSEAFFFVWGILLNSSGCEKTPKSFSGRLLGIAWCAFCLILVASFTANLAVFLVLYDEQDKNLNGINDQRFRNPSANFSFGTVLNSNTYQYFKRHIELSTLFRKMENHNFKNSRDAIQALLNNSLGAFIWDSVRLEFEASHNCDLRARGPLFGRSAYSVALQKNSAWTSHISSAILKFSEDGTLAKLHDKWILNAGNNQCDRQVRKTPARLGLHNMYESFVLLGIGILIGSILSYIDFYLGRRKEQKLKSKQLAQNYALKWKSHLRHNQFESNQNGRGNQKKPIKLLCCYTSKQNRNTASIQRKLGRGESESSSMFVPELNFGKNPAHVYCSKCRRAIRTSPRPVIGLFAILSSAICVLLFLWPCALFPGFLQCFADFNHHCPVCGHLVGKYRRFLSPKFYA